MSFWPVPVLLLRDGNHLKDMQINLKFVDFGIFLSQLKNS